MECNVQIQTISFIANAKDIEKIVKLHLNASDIKEDTIDELEIYYKPIDGSVYYVATSIDGIIYKNEQPLFI